MKQVEFISLVNYATVLTDSSFWQAKSRTCTLLIFALIASKHLVRGLTMGAVK